MFVYVNKLLKVYLICYRVITTMIWWSTLVLMMWILPLISSLKSSTTRVYQ